ncbi:matrix protein [Tupaia virus]|uniref:Matrix protein n=1 Tax=Tupaia virus (isolate Tupaia/Thailand/-/1986) TaxID=1560034 RepID=MATRX_TUPVT|nr:matrix protein [Tupaia virus]Q4VKV5.1 RecName: Full=Matrix protein [Tupaia virus isolate Tupaia/Thailand/-/1986]AAX47599.1 matrix protein [Tupaia virus]
MLRWFSFGSNEGSEVAGNGWSVKPIGNMSIKKDDPVGFPQGYQCLLKVIIQLEKKDPTKSDVSELIAGWVKRYSGPHLLERLIKALIILTVPKLSRENIDNHVKLGGLFEGQVTFHFSSRDLIPTKYLSYATSIRTTVKGIYSYLSIEAELNPSSHQGTSVAKLLRASDVAKYYDNTLQSIFSQFEIKNVTITDDQIIFN